MSTTELGAVGVAVDGLEVPGLELLSRNDDGSVAGEVLAPFVAGLAPADIDGESASLDFVALTGRLVGWAQALHLRATAEFVRRPEFAPRDGGRAQSRAPLGEVVREFVDSEIAAALGLTSRGADLLVGTAVSCVELPKSWGGLMAGRIDYPRLLTMVEETALCDPEAARKVEAAVLEGGRRGSRGEFRRALRRAVLRHDAEGAKARADEARADLYVRSGPASTDTAWLDAHLRAEDAAAVRTVLDAAAAAMRREPDENRNVDQLRAAALCAPFWAALATGLLTTPEGPLPLAHLGAQAPALELTFTPDDSAGAAGSTAGTGEHSAGPDVREPATLEGHGPITPTLARKIASCAVPGSRPLVRMVERIDAASALRLSQVWMPEADYRPSAALVRHIRARDRRCCFPGCAMPARRCDLDHTIPWPEGETHPSNLALLCRRHHRLKHHRGVRVEQRRPGELLWTLPTGHTYETGPQPGD
jgi:hypothetical protein